MNASVPVEETIVALSTPPGEAALAVIRVCGPEVNRLSEKKFRQLLDARKATLVAYKDEQGVLLDQLLATRFDAKASYTGQAMLELSSHGNPLIVRKIMDDLISMGCRMAEPGEFTRLAYLNKKMDLVQAEAVADLIHARSERALQAAHRQLEGALGQRILSYLDRLLCIQAQLEAYIDFPEEDIPDEDTQGPQLELKRLRDDLQSLADTARYHALLQDGVRTVIVGAPNAGKSCLLNALAGDDRAIVSAEPGTTRDFIDVQLMVGAHSIRVIDTAGLREPEGEIERLGIERSVEKLQSADLILCVLDAALPCPLLDPSVVDLFHVEQTIVIENKEDLPAAKSHKDFLPDCMHVSVSAKTGDGILELRAAIEGALDRLCPQLGADGLTVNARHAAALKEVDNALGSALGQIQTLAPMELVAADVRDALSALEALVGRVDNEAMLDRLFSQFCIGK